MKNYVSIETVFSSLEERTVDNLSKVYTDRNKLSDVVHRLMAEHLNKSDIDGKSVLLKPNWVRHELKESDYVCLRTNDNLLLCILEEVLKNKPSRVLIADAPVQGCKWDKMITTEFVNEVTRLSKEYEVPIKIKDFRRTISDFAANSVSRELHPISDYIIFDVGADSYLEPITDSEKRFRVTLYNPDKMAEVHHTGVHKYCIAKDYFDYDVVITIPKLKTHRMAGMTNSLKLLIGINGDKDYLPHHRIGSIIEGGDNYKDKSLLRSISNFFTDAGNRRIGTIVGQNLLRVGSVFWRISRPDKATLMNAGWYGNDTIWRTVMDINTIALYGDGNGVMHKDQRRKVITIMDGVVGGQGDGPLHPDPSPLGVIAISDNPYLMDVVAGQLYHLDIEKIQLLKAAKNMIQHLNYTIRVNSQIIGLEEVSRYGIDIKMSPGWENYKNR